MYYVIFLVWTRFISRLILFFQNNLFLAYYLERIVVKGGCWLASEGPRYTWLWLADIVDMWDRHNWWGRTTLAQSEGWERRGSFNRGREVERACVRLILCARGGEGKEASDSKNLHIRWGGNGESEEQLNGESQYSHIQQNMKND